MNPVVSIHKALHHAKWGNNCDAWTLVEEDAFSIKQEKMPPGTLEQKHYHSKAHQFFYILKGRATFNLNDAVYILNAQEGIYVKAGAQHFISNTGGDDLQFIVFSQPTTKNDRILCHD